MIYSTDRSKAVVPVLVLLFVALWFILRGDLFYVLKRKLVLVLLVRLSDLCLFGFVGFLFLLVSEKG